MVVMKSSDHHQQSRLIYSCKVCNKGFACGGALVGHVRAHGIEDVNINDRKNNDDDEDQQSTSHKRTYFLRTRAKRFMSSRTAEGGSRTTASFLTWNSLLEHGSTRRCASREEEEDLANCLVMLSSGKASRVVDDKSLFENLGSNIYDDDKVEDHVDKTKEMVVKGMFQCKACKKVFNSHQALGGHRASHKNVKGCFAARFDGIMGDDDDDHDQTVVVDQEDHDDQDQEYSISYLRIDPNPTSSESHNHLKRKLKVHECSICHRTFSSGQALGGHKRCHWLASNMPASSDQITHSYSVPKFYGFGYDAQHLFKKPKIRKSGPLDLNLPVLIDDRIEYDEDDDDDDDVPSKFEALPRIYLPEKEDQQKKNSTHVSLHDVNSERQSKVKQLAKLSDLRDLNLDGECSRTWLQVGISPTVDGSS